MKQQDCIGGMSFAPTPPLLLSKKIYVAPWMLAGPPAVKHPKAATDTYVLNNGINFLKWVIGVSSAERANRDCNYIIKQFNMEMFWRFEFIPGHFGIFSGGPAVCVALFPCVLAWDECRWMIYEQVPVSIQQHKVVWRFTRLYCALLRQEWLPLACFVPAAYSTSPINLELLSIWSVHRGRFSSTCSWWLICELLLLCDKHSGLT
jgi:hypothetical protein